MLHYVQELGIKDLLVKTPSYGHAGAIWPTIWDDPIGVHMMPSLHYSGPFFVILASLDHPEGKCTMAGQTWSATGAPRIQKDQPNESQGISRDALRRAERTQNTKKEH